MVWKLTREPSHASRFLRCSCHIYSHPPRSFFITNSDQLQTDGISWTFRQSPLVLPASFKRNGILFWKRLEPFGWVLLKCPTTNIHDEAIWALGEAEQLDFKVGQLDYLPDSLQMSPRVSQGFRIHKNKNGIYIKKASVNQLGQGNNNLSKKRRAWLMDTGSDRKTGSEAEVFQLKRHWPTENTTEKLKHSTLNSCCYRLRVCTGTLPPLRHAKTPQGWTDVGSLGHRCEAYVDPWGRLFGGHKPVEILGWFSVLA